MWSNNVTEPTARCIPFGETDPANQGNTGEGGAGGPSGVPANPHNANNNLYYSNARTSQRTLFMWFDNFHLTAKCCSVYLLSNATCQTEVTGSICNARGSYLSHAHLPGTCIIVAVIVQPPPRHCRCIWGHIRGLLVVLLVQTTATFNNNGHKVWWIGKKPSWYTYTIILFSFKSAALVSRKSNYYLSCSCKYVQSHPRAFCSASTENLCGSNCCIVDSMRSRIWIKCAYDISLLMGK